MAAVNLIGSYNYALVALSVLIAMFASYAALYLAGRVTAAGGWTRIVWLLGGAGAMGTGIWSMHYIGMLAFILPVPVAYHWPTVLLSLFAAILASVVALGVVSRQKMGPFRALAGSVLMGAGIAGMHYIGMAAMRLRAVCQFNPFLVVLSVVFAILISLAALWITFHFRDEKTGIGWQRLAGAVVMGAAIPVMHYTGMAAASFTASDMPVDLTHAISISTLGTAGIAAVTFIVLGLALLTSWVDRRLATQTLEVQGEKLQQSEAYLAEAQRLSHTGSFGWKLSTREITWSEETFRIFQYDQSTKPTVELVLQRVHPEDTASVKETIASASRDGKDFEHEYRLVMPDGTIKYVHVVAHAERDESGEIEFVGAVMDVSDRKRAEEELRQSEALAEQRLRLVVDTTPAMINSCGPDGYLDYVNKGWLDYFGFSLETALDRADVMKMSVPSKTDTYGGDWQPIIHPEDLVRFRDHWKATLASGKPGECEGRVRRFDGEYRWHLFRGVPLCDETGTPVKWYVSAFDIEDRKRAEVLLAGENRLLEMIARGDSRALILDAICRLVEGLAAGSLSSILLADPSANRLRHGAAPSLPSSYNEAVDGLLIGPSAGSCGTAAYRAEPVIVSDIATDPLWADYRDLALAHGLRSCWSTPILSSAGKVLGTFAIYYREPRSPTALDRSVISQIVDLADIAVERKQAEEALDALRQAQADLAHVNRVTTMGELTASLAHEVNQPIAAAVTNANSLFPLAGGRRPKSRQGSRGCHEDRERRNAGGGNHQPDSPALPEGYTAMAIGRCKRSHWRDDRAAARRGNAILDLSPDGTGGRSSPGHGGSRAIAAGHDEPHDEQHRCDEGCGRDAGPRHQVAASGKRATSRVCQRYRRGAAPSAGGPDFQCVLHHQTSTVPAWDFGSAAPSLNRMAAACGLPTTLRAAQSFYFTLPTKLGAHE